MSAEVRAEVQANVLRVTLDRPEKRNPLSRAALAQLREVFKAHRDAALSLALVRGAGNQSFAAGGDLRDLEQVRTPEEARTMHALGSGALQAIREFPVPVVAALNGVALGGGAELAVACDLRIAAAHARLGFVQGTLNIPTAWGGGHDLIALVGPARALELLASARVLTAAQAQAAGLVEAVAAEGEDFEAFVERFIAPFARQRPQVTRAFKAQAAAAKRGEPRAALAARDAALFAHAWCHADHWAAAKNVLQKEASR
jgi:enoyl-CoA hydratase